MKKDASNHPLVYLFPVLVCLAPAGVRAEIIFENNFETSSWYTEWGLNSAPQNTSIMEEEPFCGDSHLRVVIPEGSHYGTSFGFDFDAMGYDRPDEIYFRYAIRLGPTWTTASPGGGGKLPGFGATYNTAGWGGRRSDGTNGWSARGAFGRPSEDADSGATRLGYYVYHADMGTWGSEWYWSGDPLGPEGTIQPGRWYQIELYVLNNTPGVADGVLMAWVDSMPVYEKSDIRFRDVEHLHIERVWFDLYYGGSWTAPVDMHIDFDNVLISRTPIGLVEPGSHDCKLIDDDDDPDDEDPDDEDPDDEDPDDEDPDDEDPDDEDPDDEDPGEEDSPGDGSRGCGCFSISPDGGLLFLFFSILMLVLIRKRIPRSG